jgi:hypothetical protein
MRKITLSLATALILLSSYAANAVLNMGGKTIFTGTLIEVLEPGAATQIQDIIDNIANASATKPYLIHLGPGVYDLGSTNIVMKEWVSIQGSGQESTKIIGAMSGTGDNATSAVVVGVNNASLTDLNIENTGGNEKSIAVYNMTASPRIERVTLTTSGGSSRNFGVYNVASSPIMMDVIANASGGSESYGVYNILSAAPTMTNVTAIASGGSVKNSGVNNDSAYPTMTNVIATASGGGTSYGVYNTSSTSPTMTNVTATGSGGTSYGIYIISASPFIQDSMIKGDTKGLFISSSSTGARVVNSKIVGGVTDEATGTTNCRGNYDANLADVNCVDP